MDSHHLIKIDPFSKNLREFVHLIPLETEMWVGYPDKYE